MSENVTQRADLHQFVQARDAMDHLMQAMKRWQDALIAGDGREADIWRLEARHRFKTVESWTRAAANVAAEQSREVGGQ